MLAKVGVVDAHRVLDVAVHLLAILVNAYLLFLIRSHSTFKVTIYKRLLAVDASLDLALAVVNLIAQPVSRLLWQ